MFHVRYHFSLVFRALYNIWKKYFGHKFSFFNWFTQTNPPSQQPKSAKHDKSFLSICFLNHNSSLKNTLIDMFRGPTTKTKNITFKEKLSGASSQNKIGKTFSCRKKKTFSKTILVFPYFISCKTDRWLLRSKRYLPSFLQRLPCFQINSINPFTLSRFFLWLKVR